MNQFQHGNPTALWQALIREGEQKRHLQLGEELESYLVFTLMRHLSDAAMSGRVMALEWLAAHERPRHPGRLRDVGDRCLLIAGLFPRWAQRRRVSQDYFVELGRGAYASAAERAPQCERSMFAQLAEAFRSLVDVLTALRPESAAIALPAMAQVDALRRRLN